jgi:hypothetical protein
VGRQAGGDLRGDEVAGRTLPSRERVTFFRGLGRAYGPALSLALIALGVLIAP